MEERIRLLGQLGELGVTRSSNRSRDAELLGDGSSNRR